jgi:hypothetical protein
LPKRSLKYPTVFENMPIAQTVSHNRPENSSSDTRFSQTGDFFVAT